jgi:putative colanic acid biosynthesis acetyltransferase WcaF
MRALWPLAWLLLFRPSPRLACFNWWRGRLLRAWGCEVDRTARVYPSAWIAEPWRVRIQDAATIGERCTIEREATIGRCATVSQEAWVSDRVVLFHHSWLAARAFVCPGVFVFQGAIVGAAAVVTSSVPPWSVVAGNPAQVIKQRELKCEPSSACP